MSHKSKRKLKDMSLDDFINDGLAESDVSDAEDLETTVSRKPEPKFHRESSNGIEKSKNEGRANKRQRASAGDAFTRHKKDLNKLQETDPEFYAFLQENDENLLNFDASDSSAEDEDDTAKRKKGSRKAADKSENAKPVQPDEDSSDDDDDKVKKIGNATIVTKRMVNDWTSQLRAADPTVETLQDVIEVFKAAVVQVQGSDKSSSSNKYKVEGSSMFNSIMRLCVVDLLPALNRMLHAGGKFPKRSGSSSNTEPNTSIASCKRWTKIQPYAKLYMNELLKILAVVAEPAIVVVLLKHVVQLVPYVTAVGKYTKGYLKRLIYFWSTGEETVRVLSFIAIIKITRTLPEQFHEYILKSMYMAYVKNCKFTSPSTWPLINFMKRSLVEVFALNDSLAYQYAFVYIRQLAIHLRNAITTKKKDSIKTVYNWQYIHCLNFLAQLVATLHSSDAVKPLVYPLVQTTLGTIKLVPAAKYYPLRFQCIRALILVSRETRTFIPVLPLLTEVVEITDFNKKSLRSSFKPLELNCILKLSKAQLAEQGFREAVLDQVYELLMEYLNSEAHTIGFPELVLPTILQFKAFLKKTRVTNYTKVVKMMVDKINENSRFITERRKTFNAALSDSKLIESWELQTQLSDPPLCRYYANYRKLREQEIARIISKKQQVDAQNLPEVDRKKLMELHQLKERTDIVKIFDESDSDEDLFTKKVREIDDNREKVTRGKKTVSVNDLKESSSDACIDDDDDECTDLVEVTSESDEDKN